MKHDTYKIKEVTPYEMMCIGFMGCPAIYEGLRESTPDEMMCIGFVGCPAIYGGLEKSDDATRKENEVYLIIGKVVNPIEAGLENKIGEGEALIAVPRDLIDKMQRS